MIRLFDGNKVYVVGTSTTPNLNTNLVAGICVEMEQLGFVPSEDLLNMMNVMTMEELSAFHTYIITTLKELVGADVDYKVMYPNFPEQVEQMSGIELFFNAMIHYCSFGQWMPEYTEWERAPFVGGEQRVLSLMSYDEMVTRAKNYLVSQVALSSTAYAEIRDIISCVGINAIGAIEITNKEILTTYTKMLIDMGMPAKDVKNNFKTVTDVLRFVVAVYGGENKDVSLARNTSFVGVSIHRKDARFIIKLLQGKKDLAAQMKPYRKMWSEIARMVRPWKYDWCQDVTDAMKLVISNKTIHTFESKVDELFKAGQYDKFVELVGKNAPTKFIRSLDLVLRNKVDVMSTLSILKEGISKIPSNILLNVIVHFAYRNQEETRCILNKKGEMYVEKNPNLAPIDEIVCEQVMALCENELLARYSKLPYLGKVYIDESLQKYNVPFAMREMSPGLLQLMKGSRISLGDSPVLRMFIRWKGHYDIDLAVGAYDENFNLITQLSYQTIWVEKGCGLAHSGDIVDAPNGASELLDCNKSIAKKRGIRYLIPMVFNFSQVPFSEMPEAGYFGFMQRDVMEQDDAYGKERYSNEMLGNLFEPASVKHKISLVSKAETIMPCIFDLETNEMIWTEQPMRCISRGYVPNNMTTNGNSIKLMLEGYLNMHKSSIRYLLALHAKARGLIVDDKTIADTVFEEDIAYDIATLVGEYL